MPGVPSSGNSVPELKNSTPAPAKSRSRWDEAKSVLSQAAEGKEPEGDAFSTACNEIARRSKSETLAWYQRFVELGRFDKAQKIFHSILDSALCADVDFAELAAPLVSNCSSENVNLLSFIAAKQVQRNPEKFPDWARTVPEEFKTPVLNQILDYSDYSGPAVEGILNLLGELPESPQRTKFYRRFWDGLFDNNPEKTFEMALSSTTTAPSNSSAPSLSALVGKWQNEDPDGLLVKLESLPGDSLNKVLDRLAQDNPKLYEHLKPSLATP
jgi:hypothetical protein